MSAAGARQDTDTIREVLAWYPGVALDARGKAAHAALDRLTVRLRTLERALGEIAENGTDYSPGYGGSWCSGIARSALRAVLDQEAS